MDGFNKQPYEQFPIAGDFSKVLDEGESLVLAECACAATDATGEDATDDVVDSESLTVADNLLKVIVRAGAPELSPYKISLRATTSANNKYEIDVKMTVFEG